MLRRHASVPSTQDLVHELAAQGAPAGTAVVAAEQTRGRGSRGRSWISPPGGLWLSVLLRPRAEPAVEVLSLRVALVVSETLEQCCPGLALQLKWPNDLILAGRKLGGVLCEARWQGDRLGWVAVGVGINVLNPVLQPLPAGAIALVDWCPGADPELLAGPVAAAVARVGAAGGHLEAEEIARFEARDWLAGRRLARPVAGLAGGVAADGALLLRQEDGRVLPIRSGSVILAGG